MTFFSTLIFSFITILISSISLAANFDPVAQFEQAWRNPSYIKISLKDVDVNHILNEYYVTDKPLVFTKTMLWDMERKKAWNPSTYIRHVVKEGKSWGKRNITNRREYFMRWTNQKQWLSDNYADVFEQVYLLNKEQKAIFFGILEVEDGKMQISNRLLAEPACGREFEGDSERRSAGYSEVPEESSTESTYKLPSQVGLCKKSIVFKKFS